MSYMSELSIAAATTRSEGPTVLDDLAHRIAHAAMRHHLGSPGEDTYTTLRELLQEFDAIVQVRALCDERGVDPHKLYNETAHAIARCWETPGNIDDRIALQARYKMIGSVIEML